MTSEVLILNKESIALASDTRITINNTKKFDGVNKIFKISNKPPVGMMIYGKPDIIEIPFETILTEYKETQPKINNINNIMKDYLNFMEEYGNKHLEKLNNIPINIESFEKKIKTDIFNSNKTPIETLKNIVSESDLTLYYILKENNLINKIPKILFNNIINTFFKNNEKNEVLNLLIKAYTSGIKSLGIIITGFNTKDPFPSYSHYKIYGLWHEKLLYKKIDEKINTNKTEIIPFAQKEAINTFLYGRDEDSIDFSKKFINSIINNDCENLIEISKKFNLNELEKYAKSIKHKNQTLSNKFFSQMEFNSTYHFSDIINSVEYLPKKNLANLAEFLINISKITSNLTSNVSIVGGDIDVAVICKSSGFQWIKNKDKC